MTDQQLLDEYARTASAGAFAKLVERHVPLVYGVARRGVRDAHLAEDVTQTVFLVLARKARSLRRETVLAAWLVKVAAYEASQARRREQRRRRREHEAMAQQQRRAAADVEIPAALDEALASLAGPERRAVLLRYVDGLSHREAAARLNITENSCRQRVYRGLQRMRRYLARNGFSTSAASLATMLPAMPVAHPAPAPLAHAIAASARAAASLTAWKGALTLMASAKAKVATVAAVAALLAIGTGVGIRAWERRSSNIDSTSVSVEGFGRSPTSPPTTTGSTGASTSPVPQTIATANGGRVTIMRPPGAAGADSGATYVASPAAGPGASAAITRVARNGDWLRAGLQQTVADPAFASRLNVTPEQLASLRDAIRDTPPTTAPADPADLTERVRSILSPQQMEQLHGLVAASTARL